MKHRFFLCAVVGATLVLGTSCSNDGVGDASTPLIASCVEDLDEVGPEDWFCPDDFKVECEDGEGDPGIIFLAPSGDVSQSSCDDIELTLNDEGPFGLGEHEVVVTAEATAEGAEPAVFQCEATLTVFDETPPKVEPAELTELWPPNHKFKTVTADDCATIEDVCDEDVEFEFLTATSDEPVDANGDGNTEPDIVFGCDGVKLRSERQGGGNGRVYTLTWRATDDAGNETEGECTAIVPHDQSGREAVDDGAAYTMMAPDLDCDDND
ncbi:MAG: hypothetical protein WBG86_04995 [Polyangiales bacterium]